MKKLLNRVVLVLPYGRRLRAERVHGEGTVNKQELVRAFAIATIALLGLLLGTSIAASVPKANCGPHDRPESGLQGETTQEERSAAIPNSATTAIWNSWAMSPK